MGAIMREIKFRAWNGEAMEYGGFYIHANDGTVIYTCLSRVIENSPIMQFTGLKDKNGKEIYEGDIVSVDRQDSFSSFNQAVIVYSESYGAFLLQYTKQTKSPKGILAMETMSSSDGTTIFGYLTDWDIKVIGDIYSNPELLEENHG